MMHQEGTARSVVNRCAPPQGSPVGTLDVIDGEFISALGTTYIPIKMPL